MNRSIALALSTLMVSLGGSVACITIRTGPESSSPATDQTEENSMPDSRTEPGPESSESNESANQQTDGALDEVPETREAYDEIDISSLPSDLFEHLDDPGAIATALFGINEAEPIEGNFEQTVTVDTDSSPAVVILTQTNLLDDSVRDIRYRLDFEPIANTDETQWQLVWAGRQQRCQPGRGAQDWTTEWCV
jgi:hypothetical protein